LPGGATLLCDNSFLLFLIFSSQKNPIFDQGPITMLANDGRKMAERGLTEVTTDITDRN